MIDFEFEFQYAEEKTPALRQTGGSIPKGRCIVLWRRQRLWEVYAAPKHKRPHPAVLRGGAERLLPPERRDTAGLSIGEIGELAASVFQDPRSQFSP